MMVPCLEVVLEGVLDLFVDPGSWLDNIGISST